jgi:hypothetical protein
LSERRLQGKPKYSEKTCPSATLSHHNSHMTRSGFEPRTAAVGSQRLTAGAMARPGVHLFISVFSVYVIKFSSKIRKLSVSCRVSCSISSSTLKMEATRYSETRRNSSGLHDITCKKTAIFITFCLFSTESNIVTYNMPIRIFAAFLFSHQNNRCCPTNVVFSLNW